MEREDQRMETETDTTTRCVWLDSSSTSTENLNTSTENLKRRTHVMTGIVRTALMTSALLLVVALPRAQAGSVTPVATGLNNPRGLAFGPNGSLYVAEAGLGAGDGNGGFGEGIGFTSSITEIREAASPNPVA